MIQKLGAYQILGILRPGARPLYKAQAADKQIVALKTISATGLTPEERERFLREAEICKGLDHPNLLKVHDSGEADGILFQAMDLLEGADLSNVFGEGRQFPWPDKLSIMEQICSGLDYAHKRNLVHRDIKPANIFLENSGNVRILDFGMVRTTTSNLTQVGATMGTVNYMSPEQIRGEVCTAAADVFSSGILFYQLASGRHPFSKTGSGLAQIVSAIVFETQMPVSQVAADAPEGLDFILNKALAKDGAKRWKDGGDFKQALFLCRLTLSMMPAHGKSADAKSKPATPASSDLGETVLIPRMQPPAPLPKPTPTPASAPPKPAAPARPIAPSQPTVSHVYCPNCTVANAVGAFTCSRCGAPLTSSPPPQPVEPTPGIPWRPIAYTAGALIVFLILVLVFLLRR